MPTREDDREVMDLLTQTAEQYQRYVDIAEASAPFFAIADDAQLLAPPNPQMPLTLQIRSER